MTKVSPVVYISTFSQTVRRRFNAHQQNLYLYLCFLFFLDAKRAAWFISWLITTKVKGVVGNTRDGEQKEASTTVRTWKCDFIFR